MRPLIMATASVLAMAASDVEAASSYRWTKRPLFVFAAHASDKSLTEQHKIIADSKEGLSERDIVVIYVVGEGVTAELGRKPGQTADVLRASFGVGKSEFKVVLVGKDGGAKLSSGQPFTAATIFGTIDAMPMRRDEMRRG